METRDPVVPEHMDKWARNRRLYETLKGIGLFVTPVPEPDDPTRIRHLIVSSDLALAEGTAENASEGRVDPVVKRAKVGEVVAAAKSDGDNVIHFPTVL